MDIFGGLLSGLMNMEHSAAMFDKQKSANIDLWRTSMLEGDRLRAEGMQAAGINPLLAGSSPEGIGSVNVGSGNPFGEMSFAEMLNLKNQSALAQSQVELNEAKADEARSHSEEQKANTTQIRMLNDAFPYKTYHELQKIESDIEHVKAQTASIKLSDYEMEQVKKVDQRFSKEHPDASYYLKLIGHGNAGEGLKEVIKASHGVIKDIGSFFSWFKGFSKLGDAVKAFTEKNFYNARGEQTGSVVTVKRL